MTVLTGTHSATIEIISSADADKPAQCV